MLFVLAFITSTLTSTESRMIAASLNTGFLKILFYPIPNVRQNIEYHVQHLHKLLPSYRDLRRHYNTFFHISQIVGDYYVTLFTSNRVKTAQNARCPNFLSHFSVMSFCIAPLWLLFAKRFGIHIWRSPSRIGSGFVLHFQLSQRERIIEPITVKTHKYTAQVIIKPA